MIALRALIVLAILALSWLAPSAAHAQGAGFFVRVLCTQITSPVTGATVCWEVSSLTLKHYNGGPPTSPSSYSAAAGGAIVNGLSGAVSFLAVANQTSIVTGGSSITYGTAQDIAASSSPTFVNAFLSALSTVSAQCVQYTSAGGFSLSGGTCGGGGGAGVDSINGLTGGLTVVGTANRVTVASVGTTLTLSGPQDLATTSAVTFGSVLARLSDKGGQLYNVRAYGAVPGVDFTATVNTILALTQANNPKGGIVYFPCGDWTGNIIAQDLIGVRIVGENISCTKLTIFDITKPVIHFFSNIGSGSVNSFTIRDMWIVGCCTLEGSRAVKIVNALWYDIKNVRVDGTLYMHGSGNCFVSSVQAYGDPGLSYGNGLGTLTSPGPCAVAEAGFGGGSTTTAVELFNSVLGGQLSFYDVSVNNSASTTPGAVAVKVDGLDGFTWIGGHSESNESSDNLGSIIEIGKTVKPGAVTLKNLSLYCHGSGAVGHGHMRYGVRLWAARNLEVSGPTIGLTGQACEGGAIRLEATALTGGDAAKLEGITNMSAGPLYSDATGKIPSGWTGPVTNAGPAALIAGPTGAAEAFRVRVPTYGDILFTGSFLASGRPSLVSSVDLLLAASPGQAISLGVTAFDNLLVSSTGNVGIGTATPAGKLTVATGANTTALVTPLVGFTTYNVLSLNGSALNASFSGFAGGATADDGLYVQSGSGAQPKIVFRTNGANERMRIDAAGNVGIGTSAPKSLLTVSANASPLPTAPGVLQIAAASGSASNIVADAFKNGDATPGGAQGGLILRSSGGTPGARSAIGSGQNLGAMMFAGAYDATSYSNTQASLGGFAAENWSASALGSFTTMGVTALGSTNLIEAMRWTGISGGAGFRAQMSPTNAGPSYANSRPFYVNATTSGTRVDSGGGGFVLPNFMATALFKNTDSSTTTSTALGDRTQTNVFVWDVETSGYTGPAYTHVALRESNGTSATERAASAALHFVNGGGAGGYYGYNSFLGVSSAVTSIGLGIGNLSEINCQIGDCATKAHGFFSQNTNSPFGTTTIALSAYTVNTYSGTIDAWKYAFLVSPGGDDSAPRYFVRNNGGITSNLPLGTTDAAIDLSINGTGLFRVASNGVMNASLGATPSGAVQFVCIDANNQVFRKATTCN